ncbi:MAG: phosphoribosylglycinamide formyltransferase [Candidatus Omnitrophica bacterium CG08_land_8_20_14_0_20_41_16]|uniref:Phosphoribosylglycinamide formyltransferase n=1 Tax=Candidatus Sherwoodlollariibacterium unditelluris TaxID=1974757 RepID=A0A2G9YKH6_9BACT|nr:MAG: phosphoribosylglycinamide formyltransferase [Candidatus Omnitrophica bacterium CG23_combo_of_CG06-09_8_20_14_all_41_10]PIS33382.1 MAG: phosphoribosylglycinamide formyltransferase [Candidatus Omnitrophica bacterium CG08_land_8_20_14_0_20_41_16]
MKTNIAVFASGRGSNFAAIAKAIKSGRIKKANLALLVCDNLNAPVILKAKKFKVKVALVRRDIFPTKNDFEDRIIRYLKENKIGLIVLAGFMRLLSLGFIRVYKNRIINIHPALLPSFKGAEGIKDAFDYGVKITGVTVHFVDGQMDHGPIIMQKEVKIEEKDTLESLEVKIHKVEHKLYPEAINSLIREKLRIKGRRVIISNRQSRKRPQSDLR